MRKDEFPTLLILAVIFAISLIAPLISSWSIGDNYKNVSVDTYVNITYSKPVVLNVEIDTASNNVTLSAGTTRSVLCNATIRDYNGYGDINRTNATLWDNNNAVMSDPDDENEHYFSNCTLNGNDGTYLSYWSCSFDVYYYANNGSDWRCNVTTVDNYNFTASGYNVTTLNPLYALNVTSEINYGDMAVEDTSTNSETANITSFGNMNINVSLYGYGGNEFTTGNGLAFICEIGNISVGNERYSLTDVAWASMTNLTNESALISGFTMPQRTTTEIINTTYWKLYVPPNPFGQCNGTVVFEAELP
ncbi:MAG: hypothetical protein ABH828_03515 [archaeon]